MMLGFDPLQEFRVHQVVAMEDFDYIFYSNGDKSTTICRPYDRLLVCFNLNT